MSWLLFIDESGQDQGASPYEVLAGVAVEDRQLWPLIQEIGKAQEYFFGIRRYQQRDEEAKAKKILKSKTFRLANQEAPISAVERRLLALQALTDGAHATRRQLTAMGQAKIAYVERVLELCQDFSCQAFASIIPKSAQRPAMLTDPDEAMRVLRKDYSYLFERFHHFLNVRQHGLMGLVIFDELEKSKSHLLIRQMEGYSLRTMKGRKRARLVIPEPMFVHSDLTTMIQVADLVAYIISWGVKLPKMIEPRREELASLAEKVLHLRYRHRTLGGYDTWGFTLIQSLIPAPRA
ncbi:hypothetical protein SIID45300_01199 [Candidatus Magnetaquicoccaceae bacterium FCR-1]|uniref:DUF3800 domain-containing protein n=1 Tax=Candidatus Magnetaquiglobus chichijimensis TaxID=3141448 RepID=A0ABQ0C7M2_9PROT